MAVQKAFEILEGRVHSGDRESGVSYTRVFSVWTTTPDTKLSEVVKAPNVQLGDQHPDDPAAIASSFDCAQTDSLLRYHVSITYTTCATLQADGTCAEGLPAITWTGSTAVRQLPVTEDAAGKPIINSAGQPIPDQQADIATMTLTCVKYYDECLELFDALKKFTNKTNDLQWAGLPKNWWKCQGASWNTERMNVCGETKLVYQATWSFELDAQEWLLLPLNVGYMQLVDVLIADDPDDETKTVLQEILDSKTQTAISEPRLLDENGQVVEKEDLPPLGNKWLAQDSEGHSGFTLYAEEDFAAEFGEPCTPLPNTPCPPDPSPGG
jgi:hypothetical protein